MTTVKAPQQKPKTNVGMAKVFKFRLVTGSYISRRIGTREKVTYRTGDTFWSTIDLAQRYNRQALKFALLQKKVHPITKLADLGKDEAKGVDPQKQTIEDLKDLTFEELKLWCDAEEIDTSGITTKEEILEAISILLSDN